MIQRNLLFTRLRQSLPLCILFVVLTTFASFKSYNISLKGKIDWLPEDFNPKNVILLIEEHPFGEKQNERLAEFLEKEYHWRYEIINLSQLDKNKKYDDKKTYQFVLLWKDIRSKEIMGDISSNPHHGFTYNDIDGHFLDRNTDKQYPQSRLGIGFGQIGYRKIIKAIDKKFKDSE